MYKLMKIISFTLITMAVPYTVQANETHNHMAVEKNNSPNDINNQIEKPVYHAVGVIKGIDNEQHKVSISHEAIPAISWPEMTMNFIFTPVTDKIKTLKPGTAVDFSFIQQGRDYVLQSIDEK